jgi:energy-coupling factor transporter ATP-binding protein EcfA2
MNPPASAVDTKPPYPGLRAFLADEADLFFGRDAQIDAVLGRLKDRRFLAVVGSSGCGKSSLVRAGVIPSLESGAMGQLGSDWRVADFTPGDTPLANLAGALLQSGVLGDRWPNSEAGRAQLTAALSRSDRALINLVRPLELPRFTNLLLLVDQFEEIFRFQQQDPNEARLFVRMLLTTVRELQLPVYILLTMRSDFLGQCPVFEGLPEALNDSQYLCPRMTREQIAEAIEGPAELRGATVEPALVTRLINDSEVNSDQLPLVQHVLSRIWQAATEREGTSPPTQLTLDDYRTVGGLAEGSRAGAKPSAGAGTGNALSRHCDEAYRELADDTPGSRDLGPEHRASRPQQLARRLFCGLAELGSSGQYVRRPRSLQELAEFAGCAVDELRPVADVFRQAGRTFVRSPTRKPDERLEAADVLDVTHEALLRQWVRLAGAATGTDERQSTEGWLPTEELARRRYRRLAEAAESEGVAGLLRDPELGFLNAWWQEFHPQPAWGNTVAGDSYGRVQRFLQRSLALAESERREAEHKTQQELARAQTEARRMKRYAQIISAIGLLALLTAGLAGWWYQQAREATKQALQKEQEASDAAKVARAAAQEATDERTKAVAEKDRAEQQQHRLEQLVYVNTLANAQLAWSDGKANLAYQYLESAQWNLRGWEHNYLFTLFRQDKTTHRAHTESVSSVAYSPDGTRIVSGSRDKTLKVWDAATGQETLTLTGHTAGVSSVAFSPDGTRIVSGSDDKTLKVWDAATGQELLSLPGHTDEVTSVAFSPDGTRIVSGSYDKTLKVWDGSTRQERSTQNGQ